jgi:hypothetical protein
MRPANHPFWKKLTVAALVAPLAAVQASMACGLADLGFLQGVWRSERGDTRGEERWSLTAANTWSGSSWEAKGTTLSFAEAASITDQAGTIEMRLRHFDGALKNAWEEKDTPMVFRLARCDANSAVFDGTAAQLGEHITYRRTGDQLDFIGDFLRKGTPFRVELSMQRAAP